MTYQDAWDALEASFQAFGAPVRRERMEQYRLAHTACAIDRTAGGFRGKRVLELGASFGLNLYAAKRLGASTVTGVDYFVFPEVQSNDFSVEAQAFTAVKQIWEEQGIQMIRHDLAHPLPLPDASMDLVVSNAVIEHLHGIQLQMFREAWRVLAPGGSFVITTPNLASLLKRLRFLVGRSPNWDIEDYLSQGKNFTGHVREFTPAECREMFVRAGFRDIEVHTRPGYFKWQWLKMPKKWHTFFIQSASYLRPTWGDLIIASGKK